MVRIREKEACRAAPYGQRCAVLLCMLLLCAFMDCSAAMTIIVPPVAPIIISYGMDPYTSIVAIIICQAVGLCSPLCGLCLFVMAPIAETTIGELGKHVIKLSALLVLVALLVALCPGAFAWATVGAPIPVASPQNERIKSSACGPFAGPAGFFAFGSPGLQSGGK